MTKMIAKFNAEGSDQTLTVVAAKGKRGINLKSSVKTGKGKGQPKAVTGTRATVLTEADAKTRFDALVRDAEKAGWKRVTVTSKNAFTSIPAPAPREPKLVKNRATA